MKLTKRKGFNFFRSYYDVYNMLPKEEKIAFMDALLDRQFLGVKPTELEGMSEFAYVSQTNSIDSQVKGYEDKTKTKLNPLEVNIYTPTDGGSNTPTEQVEEKEKGKVITIEQNFVDISFEPYKLKYKTYAAKIMQDAGQLETLSRKYKMTADPSVYKPTCEKYLKHFLEHLNIGEDKHERAGLFNKHFDSWLGKQPIIKNVVKEKEIVRYS
jgi:hypothetical protein